jgi:hypothetical protein
MRTALIDACVLYPAPLRDFFMRLAVRLYQPKWTDEIHEEWIRNVLEDRPDLTRAQLERTRDLMNRHGGDCLIDGFEGLISGLSLPDCDDRHVLAAAIAAKTPVIVTFNLSDFPNSVLANYGIRGVHPDEFAMQLYSDDPETFIVLVKRHREALKNPPITPADYLDTLEKCGLKRTVACLRTHAAEL